MTSRIELPYDKGIDNTIPFLQEGYLYITNRRKTFNSDMFKTRMLGGKQIVCMAGKEAAEVFYDNDKFKRHGAAPTRIINTLFGQNSVQTLDGEKHEHRKTMFMSFMDQNSLQKIVDLIEEEWLKKLPDWKHQDSIVLYPEAKKILTTAITRWVGIPLSDINIDAFSEQLGDMYESASKIGFKHMKGKRSRKQAEALLEQLIEAVRTGNPIASEDTPFYQIAMHRDLNGNLLDTHTAAVEILNLLRPTVAVSVYIALSALALYNFPEEKDKLKNADEAAYKRFVQETRRYYPFFPAAPAVVKKDFFWNGHDFKKGTLVLLDLYGNNHHPELWSDPNDFKPDRFKEWDRSPFDLVPQGGGDYITGHRCAGEWLTIEIMKRSLDIIVNKMNYTVPEQNLNISMNDIPSKPKSGFIMSHI